MKFNKLKVGDTFSVEFKWSGCEDTIFIRVAEQYDINDPGEVYPQGSKFNAVCIDEYAPEQYRGKFFYFGPRRDVHHVNWGSY